MMGRPTAWFRRLLDLAELAHDDTQQDIAARIGVSNAAVTDWKNGVEPRPDAVRKAAKAYRRFVDEDTNELFEDLLLAAYRLENASNAGKEPRKRRPKGRGAPGNVYEGANVYRLSQAIDGKVDRPAL